MVGKYFRYIIFSLKLNLQKEMQYKTSFIMKIMMMIANNAFFLIQWFIIFNLVDSIGGFGLKEILLLWALSSGSYGISHVFFNGIYRISDYVYDGKLDSFLTQPKNVLINVACSSTSVSGIGDIIYSFIVLIIVGAKWQTYLLFIPLMIISALIYTSVYIVFISLCFFMKKGDALADVYTSNSVVLCTYPLTIFSKFIQILLYTILPVAYITFVPISFLMDFNIYYLLLYLGSTVFFVFLAFFLFNKGLKRYNSSNIMASKM